MTLLLTHDRWKKQNSNTVLKETISNIPLAPFHLISSLNLSFKQKRENNYEAKLFTSITSRAFLFNTRYENNRKPQFVKKDFEMSL